VQRNLEKSDVESNINGKKERKYTKHYAAALKCDEEEHLEVEEFLLATEADAKVLDK
jgi:hypothetical protein